MLHSEFHENGLIFANSHQHQFFEVFLNQIIKL